MREVLGTPLTYKCKIEMDTHWTWANHALLIGQNTKGSLTYSRNLQSFLAMIHTTRIHFKPFRSTLACFQSVPSLFSRRQQHPCQAQAPKHSIKIIQELCQFSVRLQVQADVVDWADREAEAVMPSTHVSCINC